jgi:hypothetical protein
MIGEDLEERAAIMAVCGDLSEAEAQDYFRAERQTSLNIVAQQIVDEDRINPGFAKSWLDAHAGALADVVRPLARAIWRDENDQST